MKRKELRNLPIDEDSLQDFEDECLDAEVAKTSSRLNKLNRREAQKMMKICERAYKDHQRHLERHEAENQFGILVEDCVEEALKVMVAIGRLSSYTRSRPFGVDDMQGIDFRLVFSRGTQKVLQVKASESGRTSHVKKYGDTIPCVVIRPHFHVTTVIRLIEEAVRNGN